MRQRKGSVFFVGDLNGRTAGGQPVVQHISICNSHAKLRTRLLKDTPRRSWHSSSLWVTSLQTARDSTQTAGRIPSFEGDSPQLWTTCACSVTQPTLLPHSKSFDGFSQVIMRRSRYVSRCSTPDKEPNLHPQRPSWQQDGGRFQGEMRKGPCRRSVSC